MTNSDCIQKELDWLERIIKVRFEFPKVDIFNTENLVSAVSKSTALLMRKEEYDIFLPNYDEVNSGSFRNALISLTIEERLLLILAICNQVESGFIDRIIDRGPYGEIKDKSPAFLILSGLVGKGSYGYYPTGRFWLFLLAGTNNSIRIAYLNKVLNKEISLLSSGIVEVTPTEEYEPYFGGIIKITSENLAQFIQ